MLHEHDKVTYAIKVNGKIVRSDIPTKMLAEQAASEFTSKARSIVEVVATTSEGKEILLG